MITRYARKIIFCYDSDEAGQRATVRALPIIQKTGAEVFIIRVPDGKDPDEFVRKHGKAAFDALIANAQTPVDYRMKYVLANSDLTTIDGKKRALQEILPVVANIDETVTRNEYKKKISGKLFLDEGIVADEWRNFLRNQRNSDESKKNSSAVKRPKLPKSDDSAINEACENILSLAWRETDLVDYISVTVPQEIFSQAQNEILTWLRECASKGIRPDEVIAAKDLSEETFNHLSRILTRNSYRKHKTEVAMFEDSINILRRAGLKKKYENLLAKAEEYISSDDDDYVKLVEESLKVKREMDFLQGD